jgi:hypothetical protein
MKSYIFYDVMKCGLLKVNGRLGGTYSLRIHVRRKSHEISVEQAAEYSKVSKKYVKLSS